MKLLTVGYYNPGIGFTRVIEAVFKHLPETCSCHYLGIGYRGPVVEQEHYTLYPTNLAGGDPFAVEESARMINELDIDVLLIVNDIWIVSVYERILKQLNVTPKIIAYIPLDGKLNNPDLLVPLDFLDEIVVYTEDAKSEVLKQWSTRKSLDPSINLPSLQMIPHGTACETFRPLHDLFETQDQSARFTLKKQAFPDRPELWDAFIVLNANRPAPRKRIDLTLEGFAKFVKDKPSNVKLLLHHHIAYPQELELMNSTIERLNLKDRVIHQQTAENEFVTDDELNLLYNACEVGINTSMGEGWGLVSLEHGATGAAQITPGHGACKEIWEGYGTLLSPGSFYTPTHSPLLMADVRINEIVDALNALYNSNEYLIKECKIAQLRANNPEWQWNVIAEQWFARFSLPKSSRQFIV
ncbi:MAG: glycosyltransferase [Crocinitomicaceae bacterium]|nr:glycosyltransferase [Crocinitomicaceae bacterium]